MKKKEVDVMERRCKEEDRKERKEETKKKIEEEGK